MITVLGASGFIGESLVRRLGELNLDRYVPARDEELAGKQLGHVIYCIGLTADFRSRPFDTVEAHVCKLLDVLRNCEFESLVYLSSTRLYGSQPGVASEESSLQIAPLDSDNLYNISKAMGESLVLSCGRQVRVARLSNVYGEDFTSNNFLATILKEALSSKEVTVRVPPDSRKDFVSVKDVVNALLDIATRGKHEVYNVASGNGVSIRDLTHKIADLTGARFRFEAQTSPQSFAEISIDRLSDEFFFAPAEIMNDLPALVSSYRQNRSLWKTK